MTTFLSQGIDYLGFLDAKLRDLQGYATLAHELIQNADDAAATSMSFDVGDHGLIVENNSTFSDCGDVKQYECRWKSQSVKGHNCDFHRFRNVAGGDKRSQEMTTGAFGIGFISVYQITDQPELLSGPHNWIIRPHEVEQYRIKVVPRTGTPYDGTRFVLPWATDPESPLRKRLRIQTVQVDQVVDSFVAVLGQALPNAILFLKHLTRIELRRNGQLIKKIVRVDEGDQILVQDGEDVSLWRVLRGTFDAEAAGLRQQYPIQIEDKRTANVTVAIPDRVVEFTGLFCACLPTEQHTDLPFHINADFFPSTDRKRILLTDDYQGAWNRAAIGEASHLVAQAVPTLPGLLRSTDVWKLFERLKVVNDSAQAGQIDRVFATFWSRVQPRIQSTRSVATSTNEWRSPGDVYLLERPEEEFCLPLLEQIGLPIVHPELRGFYSLLRNVGVHLFGLAHLAHALRAAGLNEPIEIEQAPPWIRSPEARELLGREIALLRERHSRPDAVESISRCAIALARDGQLRPPAQLYQPALEIVPALVALELEDILLAKQNPRGIAMLVDEFQPLDVLDVLETLPERCFEQLWLERKNLLLALIDWFIAHRNVVLSKDEIKGRLRALPIWPSDQAVSPLDALVVPGTFEDPLQLTSVLNLEVYRNRRDFLSELGAKRLNVQTYASEFVPRAFASQQAISAADRRQLVALLATKLGEMHDHEQVRRNLARCELIECRDGVFRAASEVYFNTQAIADGFGDVPIVVLPPERPEAVQSLYEWLGVAREPRLSLVIARIEQILVGAPTLERREAIAQIFNHLNNRVIAPDDQAVLRLRTMRWLPARGDHTGWHTPTELYAVYQDYLFDTQARFLDLDRSLQIRARGLIELLGIKVSPVALQVVKHLQSCAARLQPVNHEVYRFLNNHANDPALGALRGTSCLYLDGRYIAPSHVFWGEHGFGHYRYRLSIDLRNYVQLLSRLGVRENPQPEDAIQVLKEISLSFQSSQVSLDDEAYTVLITCWRQLSEALERGTIPQWWLAELEEIPLIPTEDRLLRSADDMFFDDRPGVADHFRISNFKKAHTTPRISGAWRAMEAAGVRLLSKAVKVTLVECENRAPADDLLTRIQERADLIKRVIEAHQTDGRPYDLSLLDRLGVERVSNLAIDYSFRTAQRSYLSDPDHVAAYFDDTCNVLYVQESSRLWPALARELAYALNPQGESIYLAAGLKEVLTANTSEAATEALSELGYAQLVVVATVHVDQDAVGFDEEESIPNDESSVAETERVDGKGTVGSGKVGGESTPSTPAPTSCPGEAPQPGSAQKSDPEPTRQNGATNGSSRTNGTATGSAETNGTSGARSGSAETSGTGGTRGGSAESNGTSGARGDGRTSSAHDTSGSDGATDHQSERQRGRLRTYVASAREQPANNSPEVSTRIQAVDRAGIARVLQFERDAGRFPREMPHENPGYDIESCDMTGTIVRYIEVKSVSANWDSLGVALSSVQFSQAHVFTDQYWLYVVEHAEHPDAHIYAIQDPARRVDQFFYDDGWRNVSES